MISKMSRGQEERRCRRGHAAMAWICVAALGLLASACGGDDGAAVAESSASAPVSSADNMRVKKHLLRESSLNEHTWDREAAGVEVPKS